jgi:ankyrin repeat protein
MVSVRLKMSQFAAGLRVLRTRRFSLMKRRLLAALAPLCFALALTAGLSRPGAAAAPAPLPPAVSKLVFAVLSDNAAMARAALAEGADVNANTGEGRTPLIVAAMASRPAMVRLLLEKGADPARLSNDTKIGNAVTAAFWGENGDELRRPVGQSDPKKRAKALEVLKLVAAKRQGLNAKVRRDGQEVTALMMATRYGAEDAAKILRDAGA